MPKEDLVVILRKLLRTDIYLDFLLALEEADLRSLIACIRERLDRKDADRMRNGVRLMKQSDLISALMKKENLTHTSAEAAVKLVFSCFAQALVKGDRIGNQGIRELGDENYAPYTGRNPKSGQKTEVKPKRLPFSKRARN